MKKYLSLIYLGLLLVGLLTLVACGTSGNEESNTTGSDTESDSTEESAADEPEEKKVLQIGTDAAFAPFEFMETGEIVGFDVDILEAVMVEAGYEYELKNVGWDPMFASLQQKDLDFGVSAITINDDRKATYDFSTPYFKSTHMIVFNEGSDITSAADLEGLKIGVQNGTTGEDAAEKIVGENSSTISKYETTAVAFMALANGDIEAVVTDNVVADEYVANNPDAKVEAITDEESFEAEYYGFMFPKDSELVTDVDAALTTVIESGKYAEIYKEWFGAEPNTDELLNAAE
ncbi:basic amino acid ABC transporter substrate-binding protein [Aquibacillus rhizosphaerae]|uniref:Basic amino acid ABC transporter substrate-binding protein n=1 Tax=Aquibacillus rhizosphaerae TaxID=3051431 RepID=A0ABT7L4I3_9BACI|nr:basic amino acid ABC transporter substrate-binding protein [Aquibacillus sp. LR5S19]MDL4839511.1 basic amino acid ABC transporter substrate-binding protein [Aquibacillus sp. LR5S19]